MIAWEMVRWLVELFRRGGEGSEGGGACVYLAVRDVGSGCDGQVGGLGVDRRLWKVDPCIVDHLEGRSKRCISRLSPQSHPPIYKGAVEVILVPVQHGERPFTDRVLVPKKEIMYV